MKKVDDRHKSRPSALPFHPPHERFARGVHRAESSWHSLLSEHLLKVGGKTTLSSITSPAGTTCFIKAHAVVGANKVLSAYRAACSCESCVSNASLLENVFS